MAFLGKEPINFGTIIFFHKNYLIFKIDLAVVMNFFAAFSTTSAPFFVKFL